jgi:hypothetical protein
VPLQLLLFFIVTGWVAAALLTALSTGVADLYDLYSLSFCALSIFLYMTLFSLSVWLFVRLLFSYILSVLF